MFVTFHDGKKYLRTIFVHQDYWDSFCKMLGGVPNGMVLFGGLTAYRFPFDEVLVEY